MKYIKTYLILAIAILGFSSANVQAQTYRNAGSVSQQTVEKKVMKELLKLPYYGVFDSLKFKLEGDTVTLYGKVNRPATRKDAEYAVKRIAGVSSVINNIEVLPLSSFDDSIRYNMLRTFANSGGLYRYLWHTNPSVRIIVEGGHVTLEGYVANRGDYNLMNILARGVPGVFSVRNNLLIEKEINQ
jgi:hyperosmotically inducible protein